MTDQFLYRRRGFLATLGSAVLAGPFSVMAQQPVARFFEHLTFSCYLGSVKPEPECYRAVLAMLVGVNVGPNLTYVGSLATLLWRRIVHAHDEETDMGEFTRLGVRTVPPILVASTLALWLALQVV